jgi:pheromone shutdown protein TraB
LGTALVLGHPLSVLTAFFAAPISSLSPLLAAGWFAGIVEAIMRKPMVSDLERIPEDIHTLKGFMSNRFLHVLLVVMSANLFSTLGTILSTMEIFKNFFETIF